MATLGNTEDWALLRLCGRSEEALGDRGRILFDASDIEFSEIPDLVELMLEIVRDSSLGKCS